MTECEDSQAQTLTDKVFSKENAQDTSNDEETRIQSEQVAPEELHGEENTLNSELVSSSKTPQVDQLSDEPYENLNKKAGLLSITETDKTSITMSPNTDAELVNNHLEESANGTVSNQLPDDAKTVSPENDISASEQENIKNDEKTKVNEEDTTPDATADDANGHVDNNILVTSDNQGDTTDITNEESKTFLNRQNSATLVSGQNDASSLPEGTYSSNHENISQQNNSGEISPNLSEREGNTWSKDDSCKAESATSEHQMSESSFVKRFPDRSFYKPTLSSAAKERKKYSNQTESCKTNSPSGKIGKSPKDDEKEKTTTVTISNARFMKPTIAASAKFAEKKIIKEEKVSSSTLKSSWKM